MDIITQILNTLSIGEFKEKVMAQAQTMKLRL